MSYAIHNRQLWCAEGFVACTFIAGPVNVNLCINARLLYPNLKCRLNGGGGMIPLISNGLSCWKPPSCRPKILSGYILRDAPILNLQDLIEMCEVVTGKGGIAWD